ncbi:hypothetical protein WKW50_05260 [Ochrobactrum sp. GPK 3]
MDKTREKGDVRLTTSGNNGDVRIRLETDGGEVHFTISPQGATNFGVQLIKAAQDAERYNG